MHISGEWRSPKFVAGTIESFNKCPSLDQAVVVEERLKRLLQNTEVIDSRDARKVCRRLAVSNFQSIPHLAWLSNSIIDALKQAYPNLISNIRVRLGEVEETLSRDVLRKRSEFAATELKDEDVDIKFVCRDTISFEMREEFLRYLKTGRIEITSKNAVDICYLAFHNKVHPLLDMYYDYLTQPFLQSQKFTDLARLALKEGISKLTTLCIYVVFWEPRFSDDFRNLSPEAAKLLDTCYALRSSGVRFNSVNYIDIQDVHFLNGKTLDNLKYIQKECQWECLTVSQKNDEYGSDTLGVLSEIFTAPKKLTLSDSRVTALPPAWLRSLKNISVRDAALQEFSSEIAEHVGFSSCPDLKRIDTKNAKSVYFSSCDNVEEVNASSAYSLVGNSLVLKRVSAPHAIDVELKDCPALTDLFVPMADEITCNKTAIKSLDTHNARRLNLNGNALLEEVDASCAEVMSIHDCPSLKKIIMPRSCRLYSSTLPQGCVIEYVGESGDSH